MFSMRTANFELVPELRLAPFWPRPCSSAQIGSNHLTRVYEAFSLKAGQTPPIFLIYARRSGGEI